MPNWLFDPLIKAGQVDKPVRQPWAPSSAGGRGTGFDPDRAKAFVGGVLEGNSSPLDVGLAAFPWGRVGKGLKSLPAALRGLREVAQTASPTTKAVDPLMEAVELTRKGPVGPNFGPPTPTPSLPTSPRGLGLEVERRVIEGQTMPRRKLLPSGGF